MKKERNTQNRLGKELQTLLAPYPDPMSRTDFRKACQIGTRTSLYLLKSGLVPCTHTGKKTRCYKIAKADVAEYLRRREAEPDYYKPPSGWYSNYPDKKILKKKEARQQILQGKSRAEKLANVKRKLADYPDVLTVEDLSRILGISTKTAYKLLKEQKDYAFVLQISVCQTPLDILIKSNLYKTSVKIFNKYILPGLFSCNCLIFLWLQKYEKLKAFHLYTIHPYL